jgi:Cu+-exporting ATPase
MTCSACSAHVQRAVSKLEGVAAAEVNLATETLRVQFDESKVDFVKLQSTWKTPATVLSPRKSANALNSA